jgi:hypothetical protein
VQEVPAAEAAAAISAAAESDDNKLEFDLGVKPTAAKQLVADVQQQMVAAAKRLLPTVEEGESEEGEEGEGEDEVMMADPMECEY